jgi:hypothetical protein
VNVYIEPRLVDRILVDSRAQREDFGVLPAIQETMVLLWERRRHRYISLEAYDSIRTSDAQGLAAALALKADSVLNRTINASMWTREHPLRPIAFKTCAVDRAVGKKRLPATAPSPSLY